MFSSYHFPVFKEWRRQLGNVTLFILSLGTLLVLSGLILDLLFNGLYTLLQK